MDYKYNGKNVSTERPSDSGGAAAEEEKRRARKAAANKKYLLMALILVGVILVCAVLYLFTEQKCLIWGHAWEDASCTIPKRCITCGKTEGIPLNHVWNAADCEQPQTCINCTYSKGVPLGHTWEGPTCRQPATCSACGKTEGDSLGHNWQSATCEKPAFCLSCGAVDGEALDHDWQPATKTDPETCTRCGATVGTPLPPTLFFDQYRCYNMATPQVQCEDDQLILAWTGRRPVSSSDSFFLMYEEDTIADTYSEVTSYFTFSWNDYGVTITPKKALPYGAYGLVLVNSEAGYLDLILSYGYEGDLYHYPYSEYYFSDASFQNQLHGWYLTRSNTGLGSSTSFSARAIFADSYDMCRIVEHSQYYGYPSNEGSMDGFLTYGYIQHGIEVLWLLSGPNGWYMGADSYGNVYFTKTPTEACYWRKLD